MSDRYPLTSPNIRLDYPAPRVLRMTLDNPSQLNALTSAMHNDIIAVLSRVDDDPEVRCVIVTGAGKGFSSGGALESLASEGPADPASNVYHQFQQGSGLVKALVDTRKPIISAINGVAVGAGLALALLCDISIASKTAKLFDGHTRIGVAAGDHAALIWPLLCGMAKAKYFLLTNDPLTGEEAERHNLVSMAVDADQLEQKAIEVATKLAGMAPAAIRITKHTLNHWLRQAMPIFELSLALELIGFEGAEAAEAIAAVAEKRPANFPRDSAF